MTGKHRQNAGAHERHRQAGHYRVAEVFVFQFECWKKEVVHLQRRGEYGRLIRVPAAGPVHIQFLKRHHVRLMFMDCLGDAIGRQLSVAPDAAVHVISHYAQLFRHC
jgi:hypothetical protein